MRKKSLATSLKVMEVLALGLVALSLGFILLVQGTDLQASLVKERESDLKKFDLLLFSGLNGLRQDLRVWESLPEELSSLSIRTEISDVYRLDPDLEVTEVRKRDRRSAIFPGFSMAATLPAQFFRSLDPKAMDWEISPVMRAAETGDPSLYLAKRLGQDILAARVDLNIFMKELRDVADYSGVILLILGKDQFVQGTTHPEAGLYVLPETSGDTVSYKGESWMVVRAHSGVLTNDLAILTPLTPARTFSFRIAAILSFLLGVLGVLTLVKLLLLEKRFFRPMNHLAEALDRWAPQDVTVPEQPILRKYREFQAVYHALESKSKELGLAWDSLNRKNAELEEFTYTVSHDLKAPLITIRGFAAYLEGDLKEHRDDRVQTDLEKIRKAADHSLKLLDDLLRLSRLGTVKGRPEVFSMGEAVQIAEENFSRRFLSAGGTLILPKNWPPVAGDRERLGQVWQNLVENAFKYRLPDTPPRAELGWSDGGDKWIFFCKDQGMGLPEGAQDRIFVLFQKLDGESEGSGVGLAIVKKIVEAHGGVIQAKSDGPGKGTVFSFALPKISSGS